ncbi:type VI secretion system tube protein TssD [Massilia norwichensis]|uniref:Type VI secretion system tube protein Hcp n=1 Tax=Massilia norwichensis TaxID=1442366 RepID=A0ABT2A4D3_9BURK|nr:type VI secretion system tube protein TssD [Massilia norwichensis]MCS0589051.1 type VI secretion system tube protein Hcp [Massilia norwichensis]
MAIDVYLQIDGIKGESQDSGHPGWIEVSSASMGVKQPKSATASTAGGHTAERCEHKTIALTKLVDLASPLLMQYCSMGKTIPKAKLEFMRADGDGKPIKYYEVELENVLISNMDHRSHINGLQVDVRPLRKDGLHLPVTWKQIEYDGEATAKLIEIFFTHPFVKQVLFNDARIPGVRHWDRHDDHFYVAIKPGG